MFPPSSFWRRWPSTPRREGPAAGVLIEGPASRRGIGHDLDPNRETTAHSPHGGLDTSLSTPATARIGSNPPEVTVVPAVPATAEQPPDRVWSADTSLFTRSHDRPAAGETAGSSGRGPWRSCG